MNMSGWYFYDPYIDMSVRGFTSERNVLVGAKGYTEKHPKGVFIYELNSKYLIGVYVGKVYAGKRDGMTVIKYIKNEKTYEL